MTVVTLYPAESFGRVTAARVSRLEEVEVEPIDAARLEPLVGRERMARFEAVAEETRERLAGRAVVSVNSTAAGGGVAEMLRALLAYARGAGVDARWLVIRATRVLRRDEADSQRSARRPGDGGALGPPNGRTTRVQCQNTESPRRPGAGEIVMLHDPQTAGLAPPIAARASRDRRCHVGPDEPNEWSRARLAFLAALPPGRGRRGVLAGTIGLRG